MKIKNPVRFVLSSMMTEPPRHTKTISEFMMKLMIFFEDECFIFLTISRAADKIIIISMMTVYAFEFVVENFQSGHTIRKASKRLTLIRIIILAKE